MTDGFCAGAVWEVVFPFDDGPRKKYFVLLNDCLSDGESFFIAVATSQGDKHYKYTASPCGVPEAACYRIEEKQEAFFPKTTWIQFNNHGRRTPKELADLVSKGAKFVGMLDEERLRSILSCAGRSVDIPGRDKERIARALKTRAAAQKEAKQKATTKTKQPSPKLALTGIALVRDSFSKRCGACQKDIAELANTTVVILTPILAQSAIAPEGLIAEVEMGIGMVDRCSLCSQT